MIYAGGRGQNVLPDRDEVRLDFEAPGLPKDVPAKEPSCDLVLGTVSGQVKVGDRTAPDGTIVSAKVGPGLSEAVATRNGEYTLSSVGTRCGGKLRLLSMAISAGKASVSFTPSQLTTTRDVAIAR